MFTDQNTKNNFKEKIKQSPLSCMLPCTIEWILSKFKKLPAGSIVVEFGTFVGGTTAILAKQRPDIFIHSIDLNNFESWSENNEMFQMIKEICEISNLNLSDLREIQKMQTEDYKNIFLHTGASISLNINNIGFALVDASHIEKDITEELEYLWPRMVDGGYIFGDDSHDPIVANAFLKFAKSKDIEVSFYSKCVRIKKENSVSTQDRSKWFDTLLFPTTLHH